eukprot:667756-Rhodomonas_salina.1
MAAAIVISARKGRESFDRGSGRQRSTRIGSIDSVQTFPQLKQAPPSDKVTRAGKVLKQSLTKGTPEYQPRTLILTDEEIVFCRIDQDRVLDSIPLSRVDDVIHNKDVSKHAPQEKSNRPRRTLSHNGNLLPDDMFDFVICTSDSEEFHRTYRLRATSKDDCDEWIFQIKHQVTVFREQERMLQRRGAVAKFRGMLRDWYKRQEVQGCLAVAIMVNFVVTSFQADVAHADGKEDERMKYEIVEIAFTAFFTTELLWNIAGHWYKDFVQDPWNIFDFTVIIASLLAIPLSNLPGLRWAALFPFSPHLPLPTACHLRPSGLVIIAVSLLSAGVHACHRPSALLSYLLRSTSLTPLRQPQNKLSSLLRLVRIMRVIRLFKRLASFNQIMTALTASILPVMNAFSILLIITAIY